MSITITGLAQGACAALVRLAGEGVHVVAAEEALGATFASQPERVVWLYRAPWALPDTVADSAAQASRAGDVLQHWLEVHRAVLRKRRSLGRRLVLVNADRADWAALLAHLQLPCHTAALASGHDDLDLRSARVITDMLSQAFESVAPEHWDVFVALEALAWQAEPPAEDGTETPPVAATVSEDVVLHLLQLLMDGRRLGGLSQALEGARELLALRTVQARDTALQLSNLRLGTEVETSELRRARTQADSRAHGLTLKLDSERAQGEWLLRQVAQLQQEVETLYLEKRELAEAGLVGPALAEQVASLQAELQQRQEALGRARTALDAAQAESARLAQELTEERAHSQQLSLKPKAKDKVIAELQAQLTQATQAGTERQQALAALREQVQALQAERLTFEERLASERARQADPAELQALREENALQVQQMQMVQEELERYFLENRQLQDALGQSQEALERARRLVSRLMEAVPAAGQVNCNAQLPA